jgi:hypothetical protein
MKCFYCDEQEATYGCSSCAKKFCDFCIEEHFQSKMIPRRSWNSNKIKLVEEIKTGEINGSVSLFRRKRDSKD